MSKLDNFNEKQLKVLEIYVELELINLVERKKISMRRYKKELNTTRIQ